MRLVRETRSSGQAKPVRSVFLALCHLLAVSLLAAPAFAQSGVISGTTGSSQAVGTTAGNGAENTASVVATITLIQPLVSVTVSPTGATFANCRDRLGNSTFGLLVPNGACDTQGAAIQVTNQSNVPVRIQVMGTSAVPFSAGPGWTLCQTTGPTTCSGTFSTALGFPAPLPGPDQFTQILGGPQPFQLSASFQCDQHLDPSCSGVVPGASSASATESLTIIGPQASTDPSAAFTTTVTWMAVVL